MSFSSNISRIVKKGKMDLGDFSRALKISLFNSVVDDTRVDTGRLKGNWVIQEGSKPQLTLDREDKDGAAVKAEIEDVSSPNGVTYFINHLPYAHKFELLDAMVGKNIARITQIVKDAAKSYER